MTSHAKVYTTWFLLIVELEVMQTRFLITEVIWFKLQKNTNLENNGKYVSTERIRHHALIVNICMNAIVSIFMKLGVIKVSPYDEPSTTNYAMHSHNMAEATLKVQEQLSHCVVIRKTPNWK